MQKDRILTTGVAAAKSASEVLGHLQQLSRATADGNTMEVLNTAARLPVECLGAEHAVLLHVCPDGGPCLPLASTNVSWGLRADCHAPQACIVRKCILSQSPQVSDELCHHLSACSGHLSSLGDLSVASIPVIGSGGSPAALVCARTLERPFTVWEIECLNTVANHAAAALRHSVAEPSIGMKIQSLQRLEEVLRADLGLQEFLDAMLPEVLEILDAHSGSVIMCRDGKLNVASSIGLPVGIEQEHSTVKDGRVSGRVIAGRRPVILHGPVDASRFPGAPDRTDVASSIVTPLLGRRRALGAACVNRTHPGRPFTMEELLLAELASRFIGLAVDNARLYDTVRSQTKQFSNLYRIAKSVTSSLQLQSLLRLIVKRLRMLVDCDVSAVFLSNQQAHRFELGSAHGLSEDDGLMELAALLSRSLPDLQHSMTVGDLATHPVYAESPVILEQELRSAVFVPLIGKKHRVGMMAAFSRRPNAFRRQVTGLVMGLAELAAVAIDNARLYEREALIAKVTERELTPCLPEAIPGFSIGCRYTPAHRVGGDYYDVIKIDDHRHGLAIVDVAGKDITASMHVALCKYALRVLTQFVASPVKLMERINQLVCEHTEQDAFISMFYAVLDTSTGELVYSSAGHEPALLLRSATGETLELRTPGLLLGIKSDATFAESRSSIEVGDVLLLYTDGLVESLPSVDADPMLTLKQMLMDGRLHDPQITTDNMLETAIRAGSDRPPDDIAVVAIKRLERCPTCDSK